MINATRSCPHSQRSRTSRSRWAPNPLSARKFASRRVRSADSAKVLRRLPHTVIVRSGMTSAIASRNAAMVHLLMRLSSDFDAEEIYSVVTHDLSNIRFAEIGEFLGER